VIAESGGTAAGYRCDVTKKEEVSKVVAKVCNDLGDVDLLVNNAGVVPCKTILDLNEAEIRRTFEVNAIAQFWVRYLLQGLF